MAPLFEHYRVRLWMPEAGGRVDFASEHDEQAMTYLGLPSKREVTRTSIGVRTAMAVQVRDQGRYLGGRPPYGYRLGDAGPHPARGFRTAHRVLGHDRAGADHGPAAVEPSASDLEQVDPAEGAPPAVELPSTVPYYRIRRPAALRELAGQAPGG